MADGRRIKKGAKQPPHQRGPALPRCGGHKGVRCAGGLPCGRLGHQRGPGGNRRASAAPVPEVLPAGRLGAGTGHRHPQGDSGGPRGPGMGRERWAWLGARFTFTIPVAGMPQPAFPGSPPTPAGGRRGSGRAFSRWTTTRRRSGTSGTRSLGQARANCDRRPAGGGEPRGDKLPPPGAAGSDAAGD